MGKWLTWPKSSDRVLASRHVGDTTYYITREDSRIANRGQVSLMDGDRAGSYGGLLAFGDSVEELMSIADRIAAQPKVERRV